MSTNPVIQSMRATWAGANPRERRLLAVASVLVIVGLLWWIAIAPALRGIRQAAKEAPVLDAQRERMLTMQAQVQGLQAQPRLSAPESRRLLEDACKSLGATATLAGATDRVTVSLKDVGADSLAQWLLQVRQDARLKPEQAHLQRTPTGAWSGSLVFKLP